MQATIDAQRASASPRASRLLAIAFAALGVIGALGFAAPAGASAAGDRERPRPKVAVIVGPVGSRTAEFRAEARRLAHQARSLGARVVEVYSPWATWPRVLAATKGAKLLIYLGHGNGWPSPYGPYQPYTKNGLGLNPFGGASAWSVLYKGEHFLRERMELAPGAVVLLHHLCYASGNTEGNAPTRSRRVAKARADHYAKGFQQAGAAVVFAIGLEDPGYIVRGLLRSDRTMRRIFWSSPEATPASRVRYDPKRSKGQAILDHERQRYYFRSVVGRLDLTAKAWRRS